MLQRWGERARDRGKIGQAPKDEEDSGGACGWMGERVHLMKERMRKKKNTGL